MYRAGIASITAIMSLLIASCVGTTHDKTKILDAVKTGLESNTCLYKSGPLEHAAFYRSYEDDPVKCWAVQVGDIDLAIFYTAGPYGLYRTVVMEKRDVPANEVIIAIPGGPRLTAIDYNENSLKSSPLYAMAENGSVVITIDNLGTISRSRFPGEDIQAASNEILDLINRVRKITSVPVTGIVAASAGALIGIDLLKYSNENVVLLSPPIASLKDMMAAPPESDIPKNAAGNIRYFTTIDRRTGLLKPVQAADGVQVPAFAGQAYSRSLASLLDDIPVKRRACLSVVYGLADRRIVVGRVGEVATRHPWAQITGIANYGHRSLSIDQGTLVGKELLKELKRLTCSHR